MTTDKKFWMRGRKPELGEVLDRRLRQNTYDKLIPIYTEEGLTEQHTDIVMEVEPFHDVPGIFIAKLASGKTSLIARDQKGNLCPVAICAIMNPDD